MQKIASFLGHKMAGYITDTSLKKKLEKLLPDKNYSLEFYPYDNKFNGIHLSRDHYTKKTESEITKVTQDIRKYLEKEYKVKVTDSTYYYSDFSLS